MTSNNAIIIHMNMLAGISPASILKVLFHAARILGYQINSRDVAIQIYTDDRLDLSFVYTYSVQDFVRQVGLSESVATKLVAVLANKQLLDKEFATMARQSVEVVTVLDTTYPALLRAIHLPPPVLYYAGAPLAMQAKRFAMVGARAADNYAQQVIDLLVPPLVAAGWQLVSGGALGVDTMTHRATIAHKGLTTVVLGSGLAWWYPQQNAALFNQVLASCGTMLSTFPMHAEPNKHHFPERNRVIAGLSQGCLVVQAAARSGALITAEHALEQGRSVLAIPGSMLSPLSAGCNALIAQGARLVASVDDIFDELGEAAVQQEDCGTVKPYKQVSLLADSEPLTIQAFVRTPKTTDELLTFTGVPLPQLQQDLFMLQLDGLIKQNFAGLWEVA